MRIWRSGREREVDFGVEFGVDPLDLGRERDLFEITGVPEPFPTQFEVSVLVSLDYLYQVYGIFVTCSAQLSQQFLHSLDASAFVHHRNHCYPFGQAPLSFLDSQSQPSNHRQLPIIKPKLIQPLLQQKKVSGLLLRNSPHVVLELLS